MKRASTILAGILLDKNSVAVAAGKPFIRGFPRSPL
jgi:hypothetical protein